MKTRKLRVIWKRKYRTVYVTVAAPHPDDEEILEAIIQ